MTSFGRFAWFAAVGCAFAASVVFSERAASRQRTPNRITVTYWEKWNGDEMRAMKRVVDAFNRSQDKVFVRYLSISGVAEKTLLAASGGNPPDVAGMWSGQVVQYAEAGALTDLTDMAGEAGLRRSDYIPVYWNEMVYKGRIYAFPTSPGASALHVNKDLMPPEYDSPEKFPKTLGEFDKLVEKVSKVRNGRVDVAAFLPSESFGNTSWPCLFGARFVVDGKVRVNGPESVQAWNWYHGFTRRYGIRETRSFREGFGSYSSPENPFLCGKLATRVDGPWMGNFIRVHNPSMKWFVVPIPTPDGRPDLRGFTVLNLNTLMIPAGAKHPREAFEFIRFVQRRDVMESLCRDQECNSPLANVSKSFFATHPNPYIRVYDRLARSPNAVGADKIGIAAQIGQEVGNAADEIDLGTKGTKQALDEAQARLEQAWAKYEQQVLGE